MKPKLTLWLIVILTILSIWINLPIINLPVKFQTRIRSKTINFNLNQLTNKFPIKLGLDLQGGTELTLQTQMNNINPADRDTALEAARQVIEKRVNLYGVSEAVVQASKVGNDRRILVELPGVKDTQTAVDLIGKTAQLDFRELSASASGQASGSANLATLKPTGLTGADLKSATVTFGSNGRNSGAQVSITFTAKGAEKFADITRRNVGKPVAIFLDNQLVSAPVVQQEIIGGNAVITGNFTPDEAKNLAIELSAGALPVPIKILEQRTIGASLGGSTIHKSLIAAGIGVMAVMFFMIAYYGVFGVIADLALIIYTLIVLAIFRTGLFVLPQVTLTLAGIAGFVLSIGMAVDANILTFERIKEEIRLGKTGHLALEQGFKRSWTSIRDSNSSSLITATILYIFGTSVVRGFALTLSIGVLVSMFSAIVVTRTFLRLLPKFK